MSHPYQSPVCRSINGCGHCERCIDRREDAARKAAQAAAAEKADTYAICCDIISGEKLVVHTHTTLADWRNDTNATKLQGSSIPDTIAAPSLKLQSAPSPIPGHVQSLPVAGYAPNVEQWKVDMVNENKRLEELVLRRVDAHVRERGDDSIDGASVQIARRHVEDAFYRLNRAIMQPKRLQGDL